MDSSAVLGIDHQRLARLPARIEADIAAGRYNGAAVCVSRRGVTAYRGVHGYADRSNDRKLGFDDTFVTFSIGKQFTNVIVLNRVESGALHLDMQVGDLIPEFRSRGMRGIKLWHLLTHTSGIQSTIPAVPPTSWPAWPPWCRHHGSTLRAITASLRRTIGYVNK